jgi:hypothetical protein
MQRSSCVKNFSLPSDSDVIPFPRSAVKELPKKGTSPNKGHEATGRNREHLTQSEVNKLTTSPKSVDAQKS